MPASLEFLFVLVFIAFNGVLALSEIAIVSVNEGRLRGRADEGDVNAAAALELSESPTQFLSTVQVGITLVGILTGAFGGATLARHISPVIERVPALAPYASTIAVGLIVVMTTYLSLVFGELVPKRVALSHPDDWASRLAPSMRVLSRLTRPVVRLLSLSTDAVLRIFGVPLEREESVTDDDVLFLVRRGVQQGDLDLEEQQMVDRVLNLDDRRVGTLMTPHPDLNWLDPNDPPEKNLEIILETNHSYYPMGEGDLDRVVGMLSTKKLLAQLASGEPLNLRACTVPPLLIPEGTRALRALELFKDSGVRTGLIVDEYGAIQGMVTLTDFIAELLGELESVDRLREPLIIPREDGSYLVDGVLPIEELDDLLEDLDLPDEGDRAYQTLGGLVMDRIGRIPTSGDSFDEGPYHFEVVDMDSRRVDKVLVTRMENDA